MIITLLTSLFFNVSLFDNDKTDDIPNEVYYFIKEIIKDTKKLTDDDFFVLVDVAINQCDTLATFMTTNYTHMISDATIVGLEIIDAVPVYFNCNLPNANIGFIINESNQIMPCHAPIIVASQEKVYISKSFQYIYGTWQRYINGAELFGAHSFRQYNGPDGQSIYFPSYNFVSIYYDGVDRYLILDNLFNRTFHFTNGKESAYGHWVFSNNCLLLFPEFVSEKEEIVRVKNEIEKSFVPDSLLFKDNRYLLDRTDYLNRDLVPLPSSKEFFKIVTEMK